MSEFHYVRTAGAEGGVDAVEGPAVGLDLDSILKAGLPPFKVALEIIAAMCEVLDIADQDGEVHGDLQPRWIFLDETGAVSLEGFGSKRTKTLAPEGTPKGTATDLYGLGYVAFRLFSVNDMPKLPDNADGHDDAVIDCIVNVNFEDLPEQIVGDIQWYLAKLMAFEREDRPTAVDTWRTFIAFADAIGGPRLEEWAAAAISGGGERRDRNKAAAKPAGPAAGPADTGEEDLGGPVMAKGPMKGAPGVNFSAGGGGAKKGATAFWSKEAMKAALDAEEEEEVRPKAGGGGATSFWSADQIKKMEAGDADAPRPKRKAGGKSATTFFSVKDIANNRDDDDVPAKPPPKASGTAKAAGGAAGGAGKASGASAPAVKPVAPPPPPAEEAPSGGGGSTMMIVGVVIVLLLLCGGVLVLGGGGAAFMTMGSSTTSTEDQAEEEDKKEEEEEKPAKKPKPPKEEEPEEEEAKSPSKSPSPAKSPAKSPTPAKSPAKSPTPAKTSPTPSRVTPAPSPSGGSVKPKPKPVAGPFKVTMKFPGGRGKLSCTDGQSPAFDGSVTIDVDPASGLPINCMVTTSDKKKGVFTIESSAKTSFTCTAGGSGVDCS